jgi:TonB family protein
MRNRWRDRSVFAAVAALATPLLFAASLHAQENDLPTYTVLGCGSHCVNVKGPIVIGEHRAAFPMEEVLQARDATDAEAYVEIRFTVAADGTVQDPVVAKLIGPQIFAQSAVRAIKDWRYQPATANGVAVPSRNLHAAFIYMYGEEGVAAARDDVYYAYGKAHRLVDAGKYDEADAVLAPVLALPRLNFYERAMVSFQLAISELAQKDFLAAREHIEDATIQEAKFMDPRAKESAIRLRIGLDGLTGQFGDALAWFEILKATVALPADDPEAKLVAKIRARLADSRPLIVSGRIPPANHDDSWDHTLLRRNFAFSNITGKVDQFALRCDQQQIASRISEKAEWHVPADWSDCELSVYGDPGASFEVLEDDEANGAKK